MDSQSANKNSTAGDDGDDYEPLVYAVSGVAAFLGVVVCVLILILCRILYTRRRRRRKHQINTNGNAFSQGTALTTLPGTDKRYDAFSNVASEPEATTTCNSTVKSDASTTSSNHIRVSDSSGSSGGQTKPEIVTATIEMSNGGTHKRLQGTVSADYAEIEESKSDDVGQQKGDTLQSVADSTLSSVGSFSSTVRDSTMSYGDDPVLDNLEPGAHNTPKFPHRPIPVNSSDVDNDYEKDPDYSNAYSQDYERDPNYQKQKRSVVPPSVYQQLQLNHQLQEMHYKAPEKSLRPLSETVTAHAFIQNDYADTIPHSHSVSTPQPQNYTKLRTSTLDPLPHYTHLDINTKEHARGSGLSYVTTDL